MTTSSPGSSTCLPSRPCRQARRYRRRLRPEPPRQRRAFPEPSSSSPSATRPGSRRRRRHPGDDPPPPPHPVAPWAMAWRPAPQPESATAAPSGRPHQGASEQKRRVRLSLESIPSLSQPRTTQRTLTSGYHYGLLSVLPRVCPCRTFAHTRRHPRARQGRRRGRDVGSVAESSWPRTSFRGICGL